MRILLIDIDSLRSDHLGCYGYARNTSPTIDRIAAEGYRLNNCFVSDAPCCPSRSSFFAGRYGIAHGCVNHIGCRATPWTDAHRGFTDARDQQTLPACFSRAGYRTAFVSSFPTRHSAWHALAGFTEWYDTQEKGHELAPKICEQAETWLEDHAKEENWYCHVNFWDAHTPYRTPDDYGDPFDDDLQPDWPGSELLEAHTKQTGLRSARDSSWSKNQSGKRQPAEVMGRDDLAQLHHGYDTGIRYIDDHIAKLMACLEKLGIADETTIIITADHGEDFGEFGAYGSHCFCGPSVARIPMIIKLAKAASQDANLTGQAISGLHQHFDLSATLLELCGIDRPENWAAQSFKAALTGDTQAGRAYVVSSILAQGVQRAVYWQEAKGNEPWAYVRTWRDLMHGLPEHCLITPQDRAGREPIDDAQHPMLKKGKALLATWAENQLAQSGHEDPLIQVLAEGTGPMHAVSSERYQTRIRETGRAK